MKRRLLDILLAMRSPKILVVGDVILDRYVSGDIERISPESPAQVLDVTSEAEVLGGAGNVAANVAMMGGVVWMVGVVGRDDAASGVRAQLKKWGIRGGGLVVDESRPTTMKTRFMSLRQQMLRVDRESREDVSDAVADRMLAGVEKVVDRCDGVIVSDYGKGALTPAFLKKLFSVCRRHGKKVIVDPKGSDYRRYRGATVITPNRKEAAIASGIDIRSEADYRRAAKRIIGMTKVKSLVITRGAEGMSVFDSEGSGVHLPAEALEVFDVTGAGDTVIAAIGVMLFSGNGLEDAARVANVAAAVEVGHVGAWAVTKEEIIGRLRADGHGEGKAMSLSQLRSFARKLRAQKRKIVFTNGCFDLMHAGHVTLLRRARSLGDALVVGLNTDDSVRRLKGSGRPVLGEDDRLQILSALDCVDAIALFDEDTPIRLIEAVRPDILVKGGDYTLDRVVGRDIVERNKGRVEIIPLSPGKSTTRIIEKILEGRSR